MKFGKVCAALFIALLAAACTVVVDDNPPPRPGPQPQICTREFAPVCAARNGERRTFSNECLAETSGFRIIADGGCGGAQRPDLGPGPVVCPQNYAPVCARQGSVIRTFPNGCVAEGSGFQIIGDGPC